MTAEQKSKEQNKRIHANARKNRNLREFILLTNVSQSMTDAVHIMKVNVYLYP